MFPATFDRVPEKSRVLFFDAHTLNAKNPPSMPTFTTRRFRPLARCLLAFALMSALSGCALLAVWLDRPLWFDIAPEILGERTVEQRLTLRWPGEEKTLDAVLEIADGKLTLIASAFGARLATLEYDGTKFTENYPTPAALPGRRMIRDFLLIATPLENLRAALPQNWRVVEHPQGEAIRREIHDHDDSAAPLIVIDYRNASPWNGRIEFDNRAEHYQLSLDAHEL
jgi:hypothetical protein